MESPLPEINFFNKIIQLDQIDSTNTFLKEDKFDDRTIAYTFHQTAGRGREGKSWFCFPDKSLALSIKLIDSVLMQEPLWGIAAVSLAIKSVLDKYLIEPCWIKWPNDIFIKNKKICGILSECSVYDNSSQLVIGFGVNINSDFNELSVIEKPSTSLFVETGIIFKLTEFTFEIIQSLSYYLSKIIQENDLASVRTMWRENARLIGYTGTWYFNGNEIHGVITDINDDGSIKIEHEYGNEDIYAGDIVVEYPQLKQTEGL